MYEMIYLVFGDECNKACPYCFTQGIPKEFKSTFENEEKLGKVIDFILWVQRVRERNHQPPLVVNLWGGEPLLYLDWIKPVVSWLKHENSAIEYSMLSNATLLNQDVVDWIVENKIGYGFSHDGRRTKEAKGFDVLENNFIVNLLQQIPNLYISTVLHGKCTDLQDMRECWKEVFGRYVPCTYRGVFWKPQAPEELMSVDWDDFERSFEIDVRLYLQEALKQQMYPSDMCFCMHTHRLMQAAIAKIVGMSAKPPNRYKFDCGNTETTMSVDLNGTVYVCQGHADTKIGRIEEHPMEWEKRLKAFLDYRGLYKCKDCEIYDVCFGACAISNKHDPKEQAMLCNFRKRRYKIVKRVIEEEGDLIVQSYNQSLSAEVPS